MFRKLVFPDPELPYIDKWQFVSLIPGLNDSYSLLVKCE